MLSMEMKTEGLDLYVDDFDEWKAINGNFEVFSIFFYFDSYAHVSFFFYVESWSREPRREVEYQGWHLMASLGAWTPFKAF